MADGSHTNPPRKSASVKLGRSAATGKFVLKPATKPTASMERIREAVKRVVAAQKP